LKAQNDGKNVLAELGYSERRIAPKRGKPGDIGFDDLGNAQYRWKDERMLEESDEGEKRRQRALAIANLTIVDDEPPPDLKTIATNAKGARVGYNPYDSGRLTKDKTQKPRDLRALSKWIEAQKRAAATRQNDDSDE
jgi:hypothetical protein